MTLSRFPRESFPSGSDLPHFLPTYVRKRPCPGEEFGTPNLQGEAPGRCPAGCAEAARAQTVAAQGLEALANKPQKEGEKLSLQLILRDNDKMGTVRE